MDQRRVNIFYYLLRQSKPVAIDALSQKYEVSTRTIRYDLDKIDELLSDHGLPLLERLRGDGIQVSPDISAHPEWMARLNTNISDSYLCLQKERILLIQLKLLLNDGIQTIDSLRSFFDVSKSTIVSNMKVAKQQLQSQGIAVRSIPSHGTLVEAPEQERRRAAVRLLLELMSINNAISMLEALSTQSTSCFSHYFQSLLTRQELTIAYRIALSLEECLKIVWCDESFLQIVYLLAIIKNRVCFSPQQVFTEAEKKMIVGTRDYRLIAANFCVLSELYGWRAEENDMMLLTYYILCGKTMSSSYYLKENQVQLQLHVSRIIKEAEQVLQRKLYLTDFLHSILCEFCSHAYYRIYFNYGNADNRNEVPPELERLRPCLNIFENWTGKPIPHEELKSIYGILTLNFSSLAPEKQKFNAMLVTGKDTVSAYALNAQINEKCPEIAIVAMKPRHGLQNNYAFDNIDFVISTEPLPLLGIAKINIGEELSPLAIIDIHEFLSSNILPDRTRTNQVSDVIDKMLYIAKDCCPPEIYKELFSQWCYKLNLWNKFLPDLGGEITLSHLIPRNRIQLNVEAGDWQEAVRICGNLLVESNCVYPQYVDAMLASGKENGSASAVVAQGCALPHARFSDGVKRLSMSLITLKEPVCFGNSVYNPISVVFCLAAVDNSSHLEALGKMVSIVTDEKKYMQLCEDRDVDHIWKLLDQ